MQYVFVDFKAECLLDILQLLSECYIIGTWKLIEMENKKEVNMNIKEVADRLELGRSTVNRMIIAGQLPGSYKANPGATRRAEWRIPVSAVELIETQRREMGEQWTKNSRS
jgi:excisionase family DNA binding protein